MGAYPELLAESLHSWPVELRSACPCALNNASPNASLTWAIRVSLDEKLFSPHPVNAVANHDFGVFAIANIHGSAQPIYWTADKSDLRPAGAPAASHVSRGAPFPSFSVTLDPLRKQR